MRIKNVKRFLAGAALVACSSLVHATEAPSATQALGSTEFKDAPFLDGVDAEGRSVRYVPAEELPLKHRLALYSQQGGGALKFNFGEKTYCAVSVQSEQGEGMVNRHYVHNSAEASENMFMQANVHEFYIAAHELSHCFNHSTRASVWQLVDLLENPEMSGYADPINMLEMSIREVYADLSAVMLGASKTGDWTVFTDGVMPYRTGLPDATHVTINAVSTIISKVDPRMVRGMTFNEVNVLVNDLFQANFMDEERRIDMNSQGVRRISQEMEFLSERFRMYASMPYMSKDDKLMLTDKANLIRGFTRKIYRTDQGNAVDFAFLSALQIVDARSQAKLAERTQLTDPRVKWIIEDVTKGSDYRERFTRANFEIMMGSAKERADLNEQVTIVSRWIDQSTNERSASLLSQTLEQMVAQNTVGEKDPAQAEVRVAVAQRIQEKLLATRSNVVSAATAPTRNSTHQHSDAEPSR